MSKLHAALSSSSAQQHLNKLAWLSGDWQPLFFRLFSAGCAWRDASKLQEAFGEASFSI